MSTYSVNQSFLHFTYMDASGREQPIYLSSHMPVLSNIENIPSVRVYENSFVNLQDEVWTTAIKWIF